MYLPTFCDGISNIIKPDVPAYTHTGPTFLSPAVTVGESEGAMDSTSVLFSTSSFAYNFAGK